MVMRNNTEYMSIYKIIVFSVICLSVLAVLVFGDEPLKKISRQPHLWDFEPSLWESAQTVTLTENIVSNKPPFGPMWKAPPGEQSAGSYQGVYLSNYIRWDTKAQHELMIKLYDYETALQQRTFDTYNDVDCFHYSGLHDYIKYLKWGYSKVTDHACREIRLKRMTREEGIDLVEKYISRKPEDLDLFLRWIQLDEEELWQQIDKHRDARIWQKNDTDEWNLTDSILNHRKDDGIDKFRLDKIDECKFVLSKPRDSKAVEDDYVLIDRGWVD